MSVQDTVVLPPTSKSHLIGIDVVRGMAALVVAISHTIQTVTYYAPNWNGTPRVDAFLQVITRELGAWGVGLFFVLSGFCIHMPFAKAVVRNTGYPLLDSRVYARRRFIRIYPPHFVALCASAGLGILLPLGLLEKFPLISHPTFGQFFAHLGMVHPFVPGALYSISSVLWTISFEAFFYALYPVLVVVRKRLSFASITVGLFGLALLCKLLSKHADPLLSMLLAQTFIVRWWEWTLGCWLVERILSRGAGRSSGLLIGLLSIASFGIGLLLLKAPFGPFLKTILWPISFALVLWFSCGLAHLKEGLGFLSAIGERAYSLYLIHPVSLGICLWFTGKVGMGIGSRSLISGAAVAASTWIFFNLAEEPFLRAAALGGSAVRESKH